MIRIILAEDHNIVRNGIKNLLEKEKDLKVVGEALNGQEALDLIKNGTEADIILADLNMPIMTGVEMAQRLKEAKNKAKVVILSMLDHERYVLQAFQAGANGYLLKNISTDELVFALRHIHVDGRYICSELALRFLDRLLDQPSRMHAGLETGIDFSERLFTSKRTIEGHRQILLEKTGTRNSAALIRYAVLNGLIH